MIILHPSRCHTPGDVRAVERATGLVAVADGDRAVLVPARAPSGGIDTRAWCAAPDGLGLPAGGEGVGE